MFKEFKRVVLKREPVKKEKQENTNSLPSDAVASSKNCIAIGHGAVATGEYCTCPEDMKGVK